MASKLALFDIDGILIKEGFLVDRFRYAIKNVFNIDTDLSKIETSGKTDTLIMLEICKRSNVLEQEVKLHIKDLHRGMLDYVRENIVKADIILQPGVKKFLDLLRKENWLLGLVTGNLKEIAEIKLEAVGIWNLFSCGGFGDTFEKRSYLIKEAVRQIEQKSKEKIDHKNVFYFGDAPLDIKAGQEAGVATIAVATGSYPLSSLSKFNPDLSFENLTKADDLLKTLSNKYL